jgi:cytidylate kinase
MLAICRYRKYFGCDYQQVIIFELQISNKKIDYLLGQIYRSECGKLIVFTIYLLS